MPTRALALASVLLACILAFGAPGCGRDEKPAPPGVPETPEPPAPDVGESGPAGEEIGMPAAVRREDGPPVPERDPTEPEAGETRPGGAAVQVSYPCIPGDPQAGAAHYASLCASCHGARGDGQGPAAAGLNPKPARHDDGAVMNDLTNEYLFTIIQEGGPAVGKSPLMAAWGGTLSSEQIWDVVAFVRSLAEPAYHCPAS